MLLVKTSSMGDLIHALAVVEDLRVFRPDVRLDWLAEEAFVDIPALHPAVQRVVPVAMRRWKKNPGDRRTWHEMGLLRSQIREARYDLVLDLQGLVKSALWTWLTRSPVRIGPDRWHARERLASLAYNRPVAFDPAQHAVERLRTMAARGLGYTVQGLPRFGLRVPGSAPDWLPRTPYVVCLHATSRPEKRWPVAHWQALGHRLGALGYQVVLPWGSLAEQGAATELAAGLATALVPPAMTLREAAWLLERAQGVVGVDTGLSHLAAALGKPTVALFAATPAWRYGPYWHPHTLAMGQDGVWPQPDDVLGALVQSIRLQAEPDPAPAPAAKAL